MTTPEIQAAMAECRDCAMVMLENATFVQRELPNVQMDADLLSQTEQVCSDMVGTKHDIISDLFELDEKLQSADVAQARDYAASTLGRLVRWMSEDMVKMHELIVGLEAASKRDPKSGSAFMLVLESATNILNAFNRVRAAVDLLKAEVRTTNFRPDYGLALIRAGVNRDLQSNFYTLHLDHISAICPGQFTTLITVILNEAEHALTLDFDEDKLNDILERAQPATVSRVRAWLSSLQDVGTLEIPEHITFGACASLGEEQRAEKEIYVPLIIQEVFAK